MLVKKDFRIAFFIYLNFLQKPKITKVVFMKYIRRKFELNAINSRLAYIKVSIYMVRAKSIYDICEGSGDISRTD